MYQNMMDTIGFVSQFDPEVGQAMNEELGRQRRNLVFTYWRVSV